MPFLGVQTTSLPNSGVSLAAASALSSSRSDGLRPFRIGERQLRWFPRKRRAPRLLKLRTGFRLKGGTQAGF
jgi:hypothetical protein